jgi:hypothetical protein
MKFICKMRMLIGYFYVEMQMFGKIQNKSWLAIIKHAKSCVVDDYKLYCYETIGQPILLFNAIYKLVGVTFDVQNYYLPEALTPSMKV